MLMTRGNTTCSKDINKYEVKYQLRYRVKLWVKTTYHCILAFQVAIQESTSAVFEVWFGWRTIHYRISDRNLWTSLDQTKKDERLSIMGKAKVVYRFNSEKTFLARLHWKPNFLAESFWRQNLAFACLKHSSTQIYSLEMTVILNPESQVEKQK